MRTRVWSVRPKRAPLRLMVGHGQIDTSTQAGYYVFMAMLDDIRQKILQRQYELSKHAVDQSIMRDISMAEVEQAISTRSEVIEDYPDDKYGPSCLILGFTTAGRPVHLQCSYPSRPVIKVITLYQPDPANWLDFRTRKTD